MNLFGRSKRKSAQESEDMSVVQDRLAVLCGGDEKLHEALSNFLLLRPEEQISQLGPTEALIRRADSTEKSNPIIARVNLETAARIEMYKGDQETVRVLLQRAQHLSGMGGEENRQTILSDLDKAMEIAREYYRLKQPMKVEESTITIRV